MPAYLFPLIVAAMVIAPHLPEPAAWSVAAVMAAAAVFLGWSE